MDFERDYDQRWLPRADYFRVHRTRFIRTWDFIASMPLPTHGHVLDVAGVGPLSDFLHRARGWPVAETRSDLRHALPLADQAFDLIVCTETIEHVKDVEAGSLAELERFTGSGMLNLLRELRRALRPGGRLLVTTPNANSYLTLHKWLGGEVLLFDPDHVRELSVAELLRMAGSVDLKPERVDVVDCWRDGFGGHVRSASTLLQPLLSTLPVPRQDNIFATFVR